MKVRPGAVVRGTGVTAACLAPNTPARSRILIGAFALGWFLNRPGLGVFVVVPDAYQPWKRATVPFAKSVSLWSFATLSAITALRRTRLPTPIAALVLGGGMVVIDSLLTDLGQARDATTAAKALAGAEPPPGERPAPTTPTTSSPGRRPSPRRYGWRA